MIEKIISRDYDKAALHLLVLLIILVLITSTPGCVHFRIITQSITIICVPLEISISLKRQREFGFLLKCGWKEDEKKARAINF